MPPRKHGILPPGTVSIDLVAELRATLAGLMQSAEDHLDKHQPTADEPWDQWCLQQPRKQRPYLRQIRLRGRSLAIISYANGMDHARALADAFDIREEYGVRLWAYLSIARGAMEGFIRAAVLNDLATPPERHALRSAASALDGWQEQRLLADDFTAAERAAADKAIESDMRRCSRAGITVHRAGSKIRSVERNGIRVNLAMDLTSEARVRMTEFPSPYRLGSAVTHSGGWFLASSLRELDNGEIVAVPDPDLVFSSGALVVSSLLVAIKTVTPESGKAGYEELRRQAMRGMAKALTIRERDHGLGRETTTRTDRKSSAS